MRLSLRPAGRLLLLLGALLVAGCDTAEERAEHHYQRGVALLAEGETDRALVEFRNVFRLNGAHVPARLEYARVMRARGETREAVGQYLRVAEQDPTNLESQRAVAEIALLSRDFATAEAHAAEAWLLAPKDPATRALKATLDFRHPQTRAGAVEMARGVLAETPDNVAASMVLIAEKMNAGAPAEALPLIDTALAIAPKDEGLRLARLTALERLGDTAGAGAEIRRMAELFPDDPGVRQALIQWYLQADDPDGAEAVLRAEAARDPGDPGRALSVVRFLLEVRGPAAARAELDRDIAAARAAGHDPRPFQRVLAGLDFSEGRTDQAIAALTALLQGAEPSDATRDLQVALAQARAATGQAPEASRLLATVLEADPNHVEALKLRARLAIEADRPDQAIQSMRTAAASAPRDPEIMTIMALAHEREGSRELAGERLALAVEMSRQAPEESLRYARFLMRDGRVGPAEGVVIDALRRAPDDPALLALLGEIHLQRRDWARANQVADLLTRAAAGDPAIGAQATRLRAASLRGQGRTEEMIAALQSLAAGPGAPEGDGTGGGEAGGATDGGAVADLVQGYVAAGDLAGARTYLDALLAREPGNLSARLTLAGLDQMEGRGAAAEAGFRAVIAAAPALPQARQALVAFLADQGRTAEAEAALDEGLAAAPDSATLLFTKAGLLEGKGDAAGAIAIYETLYARDNASLVLANNLASLLASYRDDPASLERAFAIARRLRGSDVPYFQDTYGWILHRRGDAQEALRYLGPAAAALPDNALAQFHLAETERALGQRAAAGESYRRALAAAAAGSPLPAAETARQRLAEIEAATAPAPAPVPAPTDG